MKKQELEYKLYSLCGRYIHLNRKPPKEEINKLESKIITLFSEAMTSSGATETDIEREKESIVELLKTYKTTSDPIRWFEEVLTENKHQASLDKQENTKPGDTTSEQTQAIESERTFEEAGELNKLLEVCYKILRRDPRYFKPRNYQEITLLPDLIQKLETDKAKATDVTQKALINSLIMMFGSIKNYHGNTEKLQSEWSSIIANTLPALSSTLCIGLYLEELALFFAFSYLLSRGGKALENTQVIILKDLGYYTKKFSNSFSALGLSILTQVTNLNYLLINSAFYLSWEVARGLCNIVQPTQDLLCLEQPWTIENVRQLKLLSGTAELQGRKFKHNEIKWIALPFEYYLLRQPKQFFADYRAGNKKSLEFKKVLRHMEVFDELDLPLQEKLEKIESVLRNLKANKTICVSGSKANHAVTQSWLMLSSLYIKPKVEPGVLYETPCPEF